LDAGLWEGCFAFLDFLGFGPTTTVDFSSDSSLVVTDGVGVGAAVGVDDAVSGEASGVGVSVATGPSGARLLMDALGADGVTPRAAGADAACEPHAVKAAQSNEANAAPIRTFTESTSPPFDALNASKHPTDCT
jgi:hypothetical protein